MLLAHVFGKDDDELPFYPAFDLFGIVLYQADVFDHGAHFGVEGAALYIERFGEYHAVAVLQYMAVAVFMQCYRAVVLVIAHGFGPFELFIIQVHHVQRFGRPAFVAQAVEHSPTHDLHSGHFAPHAGAEALPVKTVQRRLFLYLGQAAVADEYIVIGVAAVFGRHFVHRKVTGGVTEFAMVVAAQAQLVDGLHVLAVLSGEGKINYA